MKKMRGIVAIGILSIMLLAGTNTTTACEGLTLGYWKNHEEAWPVSTETTLGQALGVSNIPAGYGSVKLSEALRFKGGRDIEDAWNLFLKQASAAYLNIMCPGVDYEFDPADIDYFRENVSRVLIDHGTDRQYVLLNKDMLDEWNNRGLI
jgi:hypothetical protein